MLDLNESQCRLKYRLETHIMRAATRGSHSAVNKCNCCAFIVAMAHFLKLT